MQPPAADAKKVTGSEAVSHLVSLEKAFLRAFLTFAHPQIRSMAYRSKTFSSAQDSPSTAFRYGQIGDAFDSIDYSDYGSIVDERSISAPSDLGGLFILRPKV